MRLHTQNCKYLVHKIYGDKILKLLPDIRLKNETDSLFSIKLSNDQFSTLIKNRIDVK